MSPADAPAARPLRIALVANTSWYLYNFRRNLMRALAAAGHEVCAIGGDDDFGRRLRAEGLVHHALPFNGSSTNPLRELGTVLALRRLFVREQVELVLSFTPKGNIYSALALQGRRAGLLMNISGLGSAFVTDGWIARVARGLYRLALRRADWVFFQNREDRQQFVGGGLVALERTSRLPGSGVDLAAFAPRPQAVPAAGGELFLMVARLLWDKGVAEFVEAARQLRARRPGTRFRLLGALAPDHRDGVPEATLRGWVEAGLVEYPGAVDDVRPHLAEADCVVLPSVYREGVPRSLLEAAAMARPVIATDSVGCRDAVDDGLSGFLCRPRDPADLVHKMGAFLALDPAARAAMGAAGRAKMAREFDEALVIEAYQTQAARYGAARARRA